jgi:hypothetical protein
MIHVLLTTSIAKQMLTQTTLSSESRITIDVVTGKHIEVCTALSNQTHLPRQKETTAMLNNVSTNSRGCSVTRHHLICGNTTEWRNSIEQHT